MTKKATPDSVSAWATGTGIGLIALMVVWLVGNRVTASLWDPPVGPIVAFGLAVIAGLTTSVVWARRLARTLRS